MSKVTEPGGKTTSYLFDKAGNRTRETVLENDGSSMTTYSYNEQNRLTDAITTRDFVTEKVWYEYDSNGNTLVKVKETTKPVDPELTGSFVLNKAGMTITREAAFMEYNVWNQMVKTIEGDKTLTYKYNGEGYRVEKKVNDEITRYMYEADKVILEVDGQGNETARNIYGTNLLMRKAGSEQYYYMYNGHGDVTALLDTAGNIAATYYYDAFGNITEQTGEADNPIRYAGYQYDEETDIYYLNARYYDPKIARFLTEDTYRGDPNDPLSLNLYTYCHNEPMMYNDPSGHFSLPIPSGIGEIVEKIIDAILGLIGNSGSGNNDDDDDDSGSGGSSNNRSGGNQANKPKTENVNGKGGNVLSGIANMILSRIESLKSPVNIKNTQDMTGSKVNNFDFLSRYPGAVASNIITPGMYSEDTIGHQGTGNTGTRAGGIETGQGMGKPEAKLSQTDSDNILALRNSFDVYKSKNNLSGMDATMRAIQEIQMRNGIDVDNYTFASSDKTTRVSTDIAHTFTLEDIHNLQKGDDVMSFIGGALPTVGPVLGPLTAFVNEVEQHGKATIGNTTKNIGLGILGAKETGIGLVASGIDTGISMKQPKNDTYNRDGVTIQAGDSYILLRTETNQGLDVATIKVYVRNEKIISYEQFGPYDSPGSFGAYNNIIKANWKKDGYK